MNGGGWGRGYCALTAREGCGRRIRDALSAAMVPRHSFACILQVWPPIPMGDTFAMRTICVMCVMCVMCACVACVACVHVCMYVMCACVACVHVCRVRHACHVCHVPCGMWHLCAPAVDNLTPCAAYAKCEVCALWHVLRSDVTYACHVCWYVAYLYVCCLCPRLRPCPCPHSCRCWWFIAAFVVVVG